MTARLSGIVPALLLACALFPEPAEAQVLRRVVDSLELGGRAIYQFRARSDRMVEVAARAADGSAEVISAAISPDSAENWTSLLSSELAANSRRGGSDEHALQQTLLVARSDMVPGAFVLFVSDTAFAQIGATVTTDEIRRFVRLLSSAASVARHLTAREFAALAPLRLTEVVPVGSTQQLPYPKALRGMRVPGEVRARFEVNRVGRVQPGTLKILYSTHPEFGEAVRSGSRGFRFLPATVNGRPVSRTVMQSFIFHM